MFGLEQVLQLLGTIFLAKLACSILLNLHAGLQAYVYPAVFSHQSFRNKYGAWCLVTGCTQGIGKEYALGLAARGMDVVLVGRNENRLEDVKNEIESLHKVKTKVIVANLSDVNATQAVVNDVKGWGIDLGILGRDIQNLNPNCNILFHPLTPFLVGKLNSKFRFWHRCDQNGGNRKAYVTKY